MNEANEIKKEFRQFISNLQKFLPKQKESYLTRLGDVHNDAKNVFPMCFTGARLLIHNQIFDKVKLVQQYSFGNTKNSHRVFPHLSHRYMTSTSLKSGLGLTAGYKESIGDDIEMRISSKIKNLVSSGTEVILEKRSKKTIGSICFSVYDVNPRSLYLVTQWMYQIKPEFSIGSEFGFKPLSHRLSPKFSITCKYDHPSCTISSTCARTGIQFCFFKQLTPDLRIASIISESITASPTISLALHKKYDSGSELKIFLDSQLCGGFTFQKDVLLNEPYNEIRVLRVIVSTMMDKKKTVSLGVAININL